MNFWKKCGFVALCLSSTLMADDMPMKSCPMMNQMTETDLMQMMDDKDKAAYQALNPATKEMFLRMANTVKMNNNPMMMMQQMMMKMHDCMSKMDQMCQMKQGQKH